MGATQAGEQDGIRVWGEMHPITRVTKERGKERERGLGPPEHSALIMHWQVSTF